MEGNELEKAAEENYPYGQFEPIGSAMRSLYERKKASFMAGANWQKERDKIELSHYAYQIDRAKIDRDKAEAELTRTSKELDAMTTKYNELSQKYADLHKFAYGVASLKPLTKIKKS